MAKDVQVDEETSRAFESVVKSVVHRRPQVTLTQILIETKFSKPVVLSCLKRLVEKGNVVTKEIEDVVYYKSARWYNKLPYIFGRPVTHKSYF